MERVLVVAVHPDDETLGCGGTLLKHKEKGDSIHWLIVTDIDGDELFEVSFRKKRKEEISLVTKAYPFDSVHNLNLPAGRLDAISQFELVPKFAKVIREINPSVVYLPYMHDVHSDHKVAFYTGLGSTKTFRYPGVKQVFMMETISETDYAPGLPGFVFSPNVFEDITRYIERKTQIMQLYESELSEAPFPRSLGNIRALAAYRGSQSGFLYAESFMLLKYLRE